MKYKLTLRSCTVCPSTSDLSGGGKQQGRIPAFLAWLSESFLTGHCGIQDAGSGGLFCLIQQDCCILKNKLMQTLDQL